MTTNAPGMVSLECDHIQRVRVKRAHEQLLLKSPPNIIFYCQFSIGLFIFEFCCATCRILNRGRADKTRPKRESHCRTVLHVSPFDDEFSDITTTSSSNREHSDIPVTFCLAAYPYEQPGYNCAAQDCPPHLEERRQCIPSLRHLNDLNQRRVAQWRHRIAATPAPLAQFDKETNIMAIVHTSV